MNKDRSEFELLADQLSEGLKAHREHMAEIAAETKRTGAGKKNARPMLPDAMKWERPPEEFKQDKQSLRAREDAEILSLRGVSVDEPDLFDEPESIEELLRNCEDELKTYPRHTFEDPRGRDWTLAKCLILNAWMALKEKDQTAATLTLFKAGRALERLKRAAIKKPPLKKGSDFLHDAAKAAWLDCGGVEGKPTFEEIKAALEAHGVKEATRRVKTNHKNLDGSPIIRTESTGHLKWKEPGSNKVQKIAERTLCNRLSKWRKEWIHGQK